MNVGYLHRIYLLLITGYPQVRIRSLPLHHPVGPMTAGLQGVQEFTITKLERPRCPLIRAFAPSYVTTYKVLKEELGSKKLLFFVIHGTSHFSRPPRPKAKPRPPRTKGKRPRKPRPRPRGDTFVDPRLRRYIGQIAYAYCNPGEVSQIQVADAPRDARQCGIATVLTELCLLDPDIYEKGEENRAYRLLRNHDVTTMSCGQAVSLQMASDPKKGAYAYFSAASRTGYNKLVVNWPNSDYAQIAIYDTDHAKQAYNAETGIIEPCVICQNTDVPCEAFQAKWIFCKEV